MPNFKDFINVPNGYTSSIENEIHSVLNEKFKDKLLPFLIELQNIQKKENYPFLPTEKLADFPYIDYPPFRNEIFSRKQDIQLLLKICGEHLTENKNVLEFGGWNGWLTNRLNSFKAEVVSVDIFSDDQNGLGSRKNYKNNNWLSVQADIEDVSIYTKKFDLIIFNHSLNFYPQPLKLLKKYETLLNHKGLLVILGVDITGYLSKKEKEVATYRDYYLNKYNFKINFYDCKGFFDADFYNTLITNKYKFISYKFSLPGWLRKIILNEKSGIFFYQK